MSTCQVRVFRRWYPLKESNLRPHRVKVGRLPLRQAGLVSDTGFEPVTPAMSRQCANRCANRTLFAGSEPRTRTVRVSVALTTPDDEGQASAGLDTGNSPSAHGGSCRNRTDDWAGCNRLPYHLGKEPWGDLWDSNPPYGLHRPEPSPHRRRPP